MAIKEPVYHYRQYRVSSNVEFIPCLPVCGPKPTATRIQKGDILVFIRKIDATLSEVEFENPDDSSFGKHCALISHSAFEWLLPIFKRQV